MKKIVETSAETGNGADAQPDAQPEKVMAIAALPPRTIDVHTPIDIRSRVRVLDAQTGVEIAKVIAADVDAKTLTRFEVVDGNLVRDKDRFVTIDEDRDIAIEWTPEAAA